MATTSSARAHGQHHQQQPYGLRYEPLRHMRGLDLTVALRATSPRAPDAAVTALLAPLGAALMGLSGLALAATLTGAALAAPLLVLLSPVLVAAALAAAGLIASGALGVAGVSALAWAIEYAWRGWRARGAGGGVSRMVVQPLDDDGKQRRRGENGAAAFVGHQLREAEAARP